MRPTAMTGAATGVAGPEDRRPLDASSSSSSVPVGRRTALADSVESDAALGKACTLNAADNLVIGRCQEARGMAGQARFGIPPRDTTR